jgi:hypothetical protein
VKAATHVSGLRRAGVRTRRRIGLGGLAGVALMLLALALLPLTEHLRRSAQDLTQETGRLQARLGKGEKPAPAPTAQSDELALLDELPSFQQNAADLQAIFEAARQAGVLLGQGDYTLRSDAGSPLQQFTATFPLHESYSALKSFTALLLGNVPHAALEEMKISRPDAGGTVLDATVRITLVYRKA